MSHIWDLVRSGSWYMGQNALGQSDCKIFRSVISQEQIDEKALFDTRWYRFMGIKVDWKILGWVWL